jgi:hypothetical protein
MYCNIIKAIYDKHIATSDLMEKFETISHKIKKKRRVSTLPISIEHRPGIPSQSNKASRRSKRNTNR